MMGRTPQCYILSFVEIDPAGPEKKIFEGFFTIYGHGGHLGHVTSIISTNFHFYIPKSLNTKNGPVVSEKSMFSFSIHKMALGQSFLTLTFNTHTPS